MRKLFRFLCLGFGGGTHCARALGCTGHRAHRDGATGRGRRKTRVEVPWGAGTDGGDSAFPAGAFAQCPMSTHPMWSEMRGARARRPTTTTQAHTRLSTPQTRPQTQPAACGQPWTPSTPSLFSLTSHSHSNKTLSLSLSHSFSRPQTRPDSPDATRPQRTLNAVGVASASSLAASRSAHGQHCALPPRARKTQRLLRLTSRRAADRRLAPHSAEAHSSNAPRQSRTTWPARTRAGRG